MQRRQFNLRIDADVLKRLGRLAESKGLSMNNLAGIMLSRCVNEEFKEMVYYIDIRRDKQKVMWVVSCQFNSGPVKCVTHGVDLASMTDSEIEKKVCSTYKIPRLEQHKAPDSITLTKEQI